MSQLTKCQAKEYVKLFTHEGQQYRIIATVRHDDRCNNGHNTLSVTGVIQHKKTRGNWVEICGGAIHDDISKHFPQLRDATRFHLCSTDGPMHYVANTMYWVAKGNFDYARSTAIWCNATDDELKAWNLEAKLRARLPQLMVDFRQVVESLGFTY